jgi:hypothetical protein
MDVIVDTVTTATDRNDHVPTSVKVLRAAAALLDSGGVEAA